MGLVCMGVLIMDMFPSESGKRLVDVLAYKPTPGGAPANVAVAAARLGVKSAFLGKVGEDAFGHHLAEILKNEGVDTCGIRFDKNARTTMNFHAKPEKGVVEYLFYRNPGTDTTLRIDELDVQMIENAEILHFDSLCLTDEPCRSTTMEALKIAGNAGTIVSFDVNYRPVLWEQPENAAQCVYGILEKVNILKLNEDELELICPGMDIEKAVRTILGKGPILCLVTLGPKGSYFATKAGSRLVPALDVDVVDTIGCGDAYIGGFLSKLIENRAVLYTLSNEELLEYAIYADTVAALTATRYGALPALPSKEEVTSFLKVRGK